MAHLRVLLECGGVKRCPVCSVAISPLRIATTRKQLTCHFRVAPQRGGKNGRHAVWEGGRVWGGREVEGELESGWWRTWACTIVARAAVVVSVVSGPSD